MIPNWGPNASGKLKNHAGADDKGTRESRQTELVLMELKFLCMISTCRALPHIAFLAQPIEHPHCPLPRVKTNTHGSAREVLSVFWTGLKEA